MSAGEQWSNLGRTTRATSDFEFVRTGRYRVDGDRLILAVEYQADALVEAFPYHFELEGFEVVEGTDAWSVSLKPDAPPTVRVVLRATQTGTVRAALLTGFRDLETEHDHVTGATKLSFEFDGQTLHACARGACPRVATLEDADRCGETILAHVRNDCSEAMELVLFAGPAEHDPPPEAFRRSLASGRVLKVSVDANTRVYKIDGDSSALTTGLSKTHTIVFAGETCDMVSTQPPAQP